jgi:hypothetical protein
MTRDTVTDRTCHMSRTCHVKVVEPLDEITFDLWRNKLDVNGAMAELKTLAPTLIAIRGDRVSYKLLKMKEACNVNRPTI